MVLEKTLQSPLDCKEIQPVHPKGDQYWIFWLERLMLKLNSSTLATWCEEPTHLKRPYYWERLKAGGEGDHREWDGWMASPTQWTWVWASSRSWWWTGNPGVLQSMGSQSQTRQSNWSELNQQGCTIKHRELWSILCNLSGRQIWKRTFTCICITESLCCTPKTNTKLFTNDILQDKKFF